MAVNALQDVRPATAGAARPARAVGGSVAGGPLWLLRLEGLLVLCAAVFAYQRLGGDFRTFAVWFLAPDLAMAAYGINPRLGAIAYNAAHTYLGPGLTALALLTAGRPDLAPLVLIWAAHIGFDRALGYGLKYAAGFGVTHLGTKGRWRAPAGYQADDPAA